MTVSALYIKKWHIVIDGGTHLSFFSLAMAVDQMCEPFQRRTFAFRLYKNPHESTFIHTSRCQSLFVSAASQQHLHGAVHKRRKQV